MLSDCKSLTAEKRALPKALAAAVIFCSTWLSETKSYRRFFSRIDYVDLAKIFPGAPFHLVATKESSELRGLALVHHRKMQSVHSGCEEGNPQKKAALKFTKISYR